MSREQLFEGPARDGIEGKLHGYTKKYRMVKHRQEVRGNLRRQWGGIVQSWVIDEVQMYHEQLHPEGPEVAVQPSTDKTYKDREGDTKTSPPIRDHLSPELVRKIKRFLEKDR